VKVIELVNQADKNCSCPHEHHPITIEKMTVGADAYDQLTVFLSDKNYKNVLMIADENTLHAAGERVVTYMEKLDLSYGICLIEPNEIGDVVADEQALVQALL